MEAFFIFLTAAMLIPLTALVLNNRRLRTNLTDQRAAIDLLVKDVEAAKLKNSDLVSKKVAADVRLGAISENLLPLLNGLPYNAKNMHHLGQPIDYLYFDYDKENPSITFVEVKSGGAKESPRQKMIKKLIQDGSIHYDLVRIGETGVKVERKV